MALVVVGIPQHLESSAVETMDGPAERLRFQLVHPLNKDDQYKDEFLVGGRFADMIRKAAESGQAVEVLVRMKEKQTGRNGDPDRWYWKVWAVEEL